MKYAKIFMLIIAALFAVNSAVYAAPSAYQEQINLEFHTSKYISLPKKISRIFVGSSGIINVKQPADLMNEFVITARAHRGSTTLFIWTADGERYEYLVNVVSEEIGQAAIIEEAIGLPNVHVRKINDKILLTGTVETTYERNYAIQLARLYSGRSINNSNNDDNETTTKSSISASDLSTAMEQADLGNIINLIEVLHPTQVRLEAQIIEISSDKTKDLGLQYGSGGSGGIFYFGESYGSNGVPFRNNPAKWIEQHFGTINATINALIRNGDARILSRPNITTMSGEQATIQIGGEIPYTVSNSNGSTTSFRDYGIILRFTPMVDAQNRITSEVETVVSSMSGQSVDGQPILAKRSAKAIVNVNSGSTMIIGGLMDSSETKAVAKIPLLGDIPILGEFFKYTSKRRDKRELIIVVTPYLMGVGETSHAAVSNDMRDYYHAGQREKNSLNDVDLNALPPPFEEENKKSKKNKSKKHDKKSDAENEQSENNKEQQSDNEEKSVDEEKSDDEDKSKDKKESKNKKEKSKDKKEKHSGTSFGIEIFGDAF